MVALAALIGLWSTTGCIQTQINGRSGWVQERYQFTADSRFVFTRDWFKDARCSKTAGSDVEEGRIRLGQSIQGMMASGATQVDFSSAQGVDLGVISLEVGVLKVGRGFKGSSLRSTMLGVFSYRK